ncbi:ribonuclease Y [Demequina capsici]|uniref:Ribonuclease Y n=1 Tax=Demequina capsici TaxID=3075620 RepID=A0AA96F801_9MICO|nr:MULTISPECIES: ribonuclease Y [unclassified Demequina]WNM23375.1 ribonuclease Y [Demequina sp. OYTSA14]WNM26252.1 ribonuclease Y [Demequina sp. PMTSA13]
MDASVIIVMLLGASLVALLLVVFARREAAAERESAHREAEMLRSEARTAVAEATRREQRVSEREKEIAADHRNAQAYARGLDERVEVIARDEKRLLSERQAVVDERAELRAEHARELASLTGTDPDALRKQLKEQVLAEARSAAQSQLRRLERKAEAQATERARQILVDAMQRQTGETTTHATTTWIALPSEEMKGRIIGREGRNIRAFESLTGVNVIVEENVNAVQLSSFDVQRREIAEVTLRALVEDGRIQPQRIEAAYTRALVGAEQRHRQAGLDAIDEAGVKGLPMPVVDALGSLRLRTSFGQTVLAHLVECAQIAASVATEVGADVELARRAAFLHDIGKAFTHERQGTHARLGAEFLAEHGEDPLVVNAVAAHHDEEPQQSLEAALVQVADAVSASRPGARRDDLDAYVQRMESLEKLVGGHAGVSKAVAMAAGREMRVVVAPDEVDDDGARELARTIAEHISQDFTFPGEIKVTVIRELRADAVAG